MTAKLKAGKQTTNLASINKSVLCALPVMLPPASEQHEIVRRVEALFAFADAVATRHKAARGQADRLTASILARAFRGELVPQDPNDEPASGLLVRIRAAQAKAPPKTTSRRGGRARKAKQRELPMLKRSEIQNTHLTTVLRTRGPLTAEALWSASQLDIDDFYDQLKDEESRGLLLERRGEDPVAPRVLEAVA